MVDEKKKILALGIGSFSPLVWLLAKITGIGLLANVAAAFYLFTWIYILVDIVRQRRWDGSKKVAWFAGVFLFGVVTVPAYWWIEIRGKQKWRDAYERVSF